MSQLLHFSLLFATKMDFCHSLVANIKIGVVPKGPEAGHINAIATT